MRKTGPRCQRDFGLLVGQRLNARPRRGARKLVAEALGVSERTISNWQRRAKEGVAPRMGRPPCPEEKRLGARKLIAEEWEKQGHPGWRPIAGVLPDMPVRLVQETVRELKLSGRTGERRRQSAGRVSAVVLAREAVWALDGTHLGRANGKAVEAQVVKDRGSLTVMPVRVGASASGGDVVKALDKLKKERGLPLVLSTDNGPNYCSEEVEIYLRKEKVVHMRSLPRTPQHNGAIEVAIRELKELSGAGKGMCWDAEEAREALVKAARKINEGRARGSKRGKTSLCLDGELAVAYLEVDRAVFYEECVQRQIEARAVAANWKAGRMREREAVWRTLEEFGLVKRTRGGRQHCWAN